MTLRRFGIDRRTRRSGRRDGSAMIIVVFAIALMSTLVVGMLGLNTDEIQLMHNQVRLAEAVCVAEAGLNDALCQIRDDNEWDDGFTNKSFTDAGKYTVDVSGSDESKLIEVEATSRSGFMAVLEADITVDTDHPHVIRIDNLRVNE